jgi:hypothetical protein
MLTPGQYPAGFIASRHIKMAGHRNKPRNLRVPQPVSTQNPHDLSALPALGLAPSLGSWHPPDWKTKAVSPPGQPHSWCLSHPGPKHITNTVTWEYTMLPWKISLWSHSLGGMVFKTSMFYRFHQPAAFSFFRESAACGRYQKPGTLVAIPRHGLIVVIKSNFCL